MFNINFIFTVGATVLIQINFKFIISATVLILIHFNFTVKIRDYETRRCHGYDSGKCQGFEGEMTCQEVFVLSFSFSRKAPCYAPVQAARKQVSHKTRNSKETYGKAPKCKKNDHE